MVTILPTAGQIFWPYVTSNTFLQLDDLNELASILEQKMKEPGKEWVRFPLEEIKTHCMCDDVQHRYDTAAVKVFDEWLEMHRTKMESSSPLRAQTISHYANLYANGGDFRTILQIGDAHLVAAELRAIQKEGEAAGAEFRWI